MPMPALATSVSRRPKRSTAVAIRRRPSSGDRTSISTATIFPGYSASSASSRSLRLAPTTTFAPAPASSRAVARPIPALAPVMATTVSFRSSIAPVYGSVRAARRLTPPDSVRSSPMTPGASELSPPSDGRAQSGARAGSDRARLRGLVVDGNDGIMATAGIVEGFIGAGAATETVVVAAIAAMVAGAIAMGSAKYAEAAIERDATDALLAEERRQLCLSPEQELAELAAIYERRGLSPELAHSVATELSAHDALAAHAEAEHDIALDEARLSPVVVAITAAAAFAVGSLVVLVSVLVTWSTVLPTTFFAVALSLSLTSIVVARWGDLPLIPTMVRTVGVGVVAMVITFAIGSLIDP